MGRVIIRLGHLHRAQGAVGLGHRGTEAVVQGVGGAGIRIGAHVDHDIMHVIPRQAGAADPIGHAKIPRDEHIVISGTGPGLSEVGDDSIDIVQEGRIDTAVPVEPGQTPMPLAAHPGEIARDEKAAIIPLHGVHRAGGGGNGADVGIIALENAVAVQGGNAAPVVAGNAGVIVIPESPE